MLVPSGALNHGGRCAARAPRGSCVQSRYRGRAPLLSAAVQWGAMEGLLHLPLPGMVSAWGSSTAELFSFL